uniref:Uncharacterized protein n=1 Tax=Glossina morsitans morsitans TaxID=37546 RepID=D3TMV6_GLOMM
MGGISLWILVCVKIFIICWIIYLLLGHCKKRRDSDNQLVVIEAAPGYYAGRPVTVAEIPASSLSLQQKNDFDKKHCEANVVANVYPSIPSSHGKSEL